MKKITYTALLAGMLTLPSFAQTDNTAALPEVYGFYPDCEYPVLESVRVKRKMLMKNNMVDKVSEKNAGSESIEKIQKMALEKGASGVILTGRKVLNVANNVISKKAKNQAMLEITADLVGECDGEWAFSKRPTPLDISGKKKLHLELGTISGWQKQIVLDINDTYEKHEPALKNNLIDLKQVYGLALGASTEEALALYGTPTLHLSLGTNAQLLGFGRNHWLVFVDNRLHSIGSKNHWLSAEVVNHVPFDDRFGSDWAVLDQVSAADDISKAMSLPGAKSNGKKKEIVIPGNDSQLVIWFDGAVEGKDKVVQKVTGYSLQSKNMPEIVNADDNKNVYSAIQAYLQQEEQDGFETKQIADYTIGEIWLDKRSKMLMFNGHLLALIKGDSVSRLHFLEQVFSDAFQPQNSHWLFNRVKQGQSMDEVVNTLGDEAFGFDDTLEVSTEPYTKELYFYNDKLIAADVAIF